MCRLGFKWNCAFRTVKYHPLETNWFRSISFLSKNLKISIRRSECMRKSLERPLEVSVKTKNADEKCCALFICVSAIGVRDFYSNLSLVRLWMFIWKKRMKKLQTFGKSAWKNYRHLKKCMKKLQTFLINSKVYTVFDYQVGNVLDWAPIECQVHLRWKVYSFRMFHDTRMASTLVRSIP